MAIILMTDLADKLLHLDERRGKELQRSYQAWLASLLVSIALIVWAYI